MGKRVAVLHGPNLDLLGTREPEVYGRTTLAEIDAGLASLAAELDVEISCFQSNHEGVLVERIHAVAGDCHGIIINGAGLTHSSVSLRDALVASALPFVEVHLSNVFSRESFRRRSLLADVAAGVISGFGAESYLLALRALAAR